MLTKRVALVVMANPMMYPPTMNGAAILAEQGYTVDIIGVRHETQDCFPPPRGANLIYHGELRGGLGFRVGFLAFCSYVARRARDCKYDWIFSYNMTGAFPGFLGSRRSGGHWLYHVHDTTMVKHRLGFYGLLKWLEHTCARRADVVVFPQKQRAAAFVRETGLPREPLLVQNAPRVGWPKVERLDADLLAFKRRCGRVVIYQGGLNWKRGLRQVIESLPRWRCRAGLCLVGSAGLEPRFEQEAFALSESLGVRDRLLIRKPVPYLELPALTLACDVGLGVMATLEQNECFNIRHLAGASNKLAEYLACGLPVIVPDGEDYREFIGRRELGVLVQAENPDSIAQGVDSLLLEGERHARISASARSVFQGELNYDVQFAPIVRRLQSVPARAAQVHG